jgi:1,4-dihydroxy-2-naphthoate octaprenyltransferase
MTTFKQYFIATRPWSFSMSLISVSLGTLLAAAHGPIRWGVFAAVAVAIVLTHAAGNVINDYFDSRNKVDQPDSPTARYRPHPIMAGMMSLRTLLLEAITFLVLAGVVGVALAVLRSPHLFWIIAVGLVLTVFYTAGPIAYKYSALGEVAIFLIWGPLMFEGAYVAQRQQPAVEALVASVPFGVLVALVLFANNLRDIEYDRRSGIKTIAILLGHRRSLVLYAGLMLSAYVYVALAVAVRALSAWTLLVALSLPLAIGLLRSFRRGIPDDADAMTAKLDTVFGLLFIVALVLAQLVRA